jgi:hypothetical protein
MMGYVKTLDRLGCELKDDLATNMILQSLSAGYEPLVMNIHMNGTDKTVAELHGMLKTIKDSIKKNPNHVMMVQKEKKKEEAFDAS